MFLRRIYTPEIMDDTSIEDQRIIDALSELNIINKFLGGNAVTDEGLKRVIKKLPDRRLSILDAGSGSSVLLNNKALYPVLKLYALDKNKMICRLLNGKINQGRMVCGDIFSIPFKDKSFDITHCSLFLHHFTETDISRILKSFLQVSGAAVIINDLRRSVFAWIGIKFLTSVFSKSDMVKNDAPLSVRKGFTFKELKKLLSANDIAGYIIKKKWAFRWLVVIFIK